MSLPRSSGILLHPTSLPGPFGVGDLGPAAHAWVETLARAGQGWWQALPVGPTGYGDSPYQSPSTFAGNLNLVSPELLERDGLASPGDVSGCELPDGPAHFQEVGPRKRRLVRRAWERFEAGDAPGLRAEFRQWCAGRDWLDDFALFLALKDEYAGKPWWGWPAPLARRDPKALRAAADELAEEVAAHRFGQFLFSRQWAALRDHCHTSGVKVIGDLPIYVALDSADVWANPAEFQLDADLNPTVVAGVPPDYFSKTGQLWGNPIYDWGAQKKTGFRWWVQRVRAATELFDLVRLDHFLGISAYWAVPFGDTTAQRGQWRPGPADALLAAIRGGLGRLPIIAEDLGAVTPEADALRERFGLPGMRVLQFAFGGAVESRFLPHSYPRNVVVYTGTHDNDTTRGWFEQLTAEERAAYFRYAPWAADDPVGALVRLAWASVGDLAVVPLQDLLGLGSGARLNTPGTAEGNWAWRASEEQVGEKAGWVGRLRELTEVYDRSGMTNAPPTPHQ